MKPISVSDGLWTWIMDHKNSTENSADKVIKKLIRDNEDLKQVIAELELHQER